MALLQLFGTTDQVTVRNYTNQDFSFSWNGKSYGVRAKGTRTFPGYLAEQYVKELVDRLMQQDGKKEQTLLDGARRPYYDKLVINVDRLDSADNQEEGNVDFGDSGPVPASPLAASEALRANKPGSGKKPKKDNIETLDDAAIDKEFTDDDLGSLPTEEELMERDKERIAAEEEAANGKPDDDEKEAFATK